MPEHDTFDNIVNQNYRKVLFQPLSVPLSKQLSVNDSIIDSIVGNYWGPSVTKKQREMMDLDDYNNPKKGFLVRGALRSSCNTLKNFEENNARDLQKKSMTPG